MFPFPLQAAITLSDMVMCHLRQSCISRNKANPNYRRNNHTIRPQIYQHLDISELCKEAKSPIPLLKPLALLYEKLVTIRLKLHMPQQQSLFNAECQSCRGLKHIPNKPVSLIIYINDPSKNLGELTRCYFLDEEMFRGVHTESGPDADGNPHSPETCCFFFHTFFIYKLININGTLSESSGFIRQVQYTLFL